MLPIRTFRLALSLLAALACAGVLTGCQTGKLAPSDARPAVLLVLTNHADLGDTGEPTGFFLAEAAHPWHVFNDAGWIVVLASPKGGQAPIDPRSLENVDEESQRFLDKFAREGKDGMVVPGTARLTSMKASAFEAIFFAGGDVYKRQASATPPRPRP